eukprot:scaffold57103_cov35-Prasinocladus_malaysianus.AAC.1
MGRLASRLSILNLFSPSDSKCLIDYKLSEQLMMRIMSMSAAPARNYDDIQAMGRLALTNPFGIN